MDSSGSIVTLKCWACGKTVDIETNGPPQFAYEVACWADDVGWRGVLDLEHSRSLVFCSDGCRDGSKKKDGSYRLRPKKKVEG